MANVQITAFPYALEVAIGEPALEEFIAIGGGHALSTALPDRKTSYRVRIFPGADCFVDWGLNPEAKIDGSQGRMMGANNPEYFAIEPLHKISVIERV